MTVYQCHCGAVHDTSQTPCPLSIGSFLLPAEEPDLTDAAEPPKLFALSRIERYMITLALHHREPGLVIGKGLRGSIVAKLQPTQEELRKEREFVFRKLQELKAKAGL